MDDAEREKLIQGLLEVKERIATDPEFADWFAERFGEDLVYLAELKERLYGGALTTAEFVNWVNHLFDGPGQGRVN